MIGSVMESTFGSTMPGALLNSPSNFVIEKPGAEILRGLPSSGQLLILVSA